MKTFPDCYPLLAQPFAIDHGAAFREVLAGAGRVLYLADNAGETVFDRVLIETLNVPVIYAVKGGPILNDTTPEDARATGRGFCRTLSSLVAIFTPLLAAWLISQFGGIGIRGIRPLYAVQALTFVAMFVLLLTQLSGSHTGGGSGDGRHILTSFARVFRQGQSLPAQSSAGGPFVPGDSSITTCCVPRKDYPGWTACRPRRAIE